MDILKKIAWSLMLAFYIGSAGAQTKTGHYVITGSLTSIPDATFIYLVNGALVDSVQVINGKFTLEGTALESGLST